MSDTLRSFALKWEIHVQKGWYNNIQLWEKWWLGARITGLVAGFSCILARFSAALARIERIPDRITSPVARFNHILTQANAICS